MTEIDLISRQDAIEVIEKAIRIEESWVKTGLRMAKERIADLPSAQPEREILDELMAIMKEYYFTHRYEYNNEAWENGFAKCMNLIPNVYMKRGKDSGTDMIGDQNAD